MLAAQGLLDAPTARPTQADVLAMIERLGVVQVDTINVARRSQYLVLWSRLGADDESFFDNLLYPTVAFSNTGAMPPRSCRCPTTRCIGR